MAVKIITGVKPEMETYLVPAGTQNVHYFDSSSEFTESFSVRNPFSGEPRKMTRLTVDGSHIYILDRAVSVQEKGFREQIADVVMDSVPDIRRKIDERRRIPEEAHRETQTSNALQMTIYEATWWEVSW